ncbi:MAG TPA: PDGLE domain-containing protein [Micromonosporaceae bacterium]|nr:PDGLE domain-containing protein [Micromonosporaceae bacterium]
MRKTVWFVVVGVLVALLMAGVVSRYASTKPDGLESVATRGCTVDANGQITGGTCMAQSERQHEVGGPLADYPVGSGIVGVLLTFAIGAGVFWLVRKRKPVQAETRD